jgi:hypothetical protein
VKNEYVGHVLRVSSCLSHLQILEGCIDGKKIKGIPERIWMDDNLEWIELEIYKKEEKYKHPISYTSPYEQTW